MQPPVIVVGKWEGRAPDGFNVMLEFLQQDGAQASGVGATHGTGGHLTGTVNGDIVTFTINWPEDSDYGDTTGGMTVGTGHVAGKEMTINSPGYSTPFTIDLI
jgi:hypothetical protein